MKNYKELWAVKAHSKNITKHDMVERCIIKAISSKSESKANLARILLKQAFSPSKKKTPALLELNRSIREVQNSFAFKSTRQHLFAFGVFDCANEWDSYNDILNELIVNGIDMKELVDG